MRFADVVQAGTSMTAPLVLSYYTPNNPASGKWAPLWDAMREACGEKPAILARADDGTAPGTPSVEAELLQFKKTFGCEPPRSVILAGWSAGCRGVRARLRGITRDVAGLVLCDGVHAPMAAPKDDGRYPLGPSEIFRRWVEAAKDNQTRVILTHTYQETRFAPKGQQPFLPAFVVAKELVRDPSSALPWDSVELPPETRRVLSQGGFELWSYQSKAYDKRAHMEQQREVLPQALARLRELGVFDT